MTDYIKEYEIVKKFNIDGEIQSIKPFGEGHINSTFLVTTNCGKYTLQKINTNVFKNPRQVMENIFHVTNHLKDKNELTLNVIRTKRGELCEECDGEFYRIYGFIDDCISYQTVDSEEVFRNVGEGFGHFQSCLADFDASILHETIKQFHDTPKRFRDFSEAVNADTADKLALCRKEVQFVLDRGDTFDKITKGISDGTIPLRVTHNDTKLNNILMDPKTKKAMTVIDLDTVMPGSMLYDFGDAIRFGASTAAEDEKNLDKVHFSTDLFRAYAQGFCSALGASATEAEKELLPYSAYLMTMECGMRFLADYLSGDTYFSIHYPEHNLVRCRTQFKLASEMERAENEMRRIIDECF